MFICNVGVWQGENLSPLFLFTIYLNDFELFINKNYKGLDMLARYINTLLSDNDVEGFLRMYVLLYADDTIIKAENELQAALNANYEYGNQWHLTVNIDTTKVDVF